MSRKISDFFAKKAEKQEVSLIGTNKKFEEDKTENLKREKMKISNQNPENSGKSTSKHSITCKICSKTYAFQSALTKHLKYKHPQILNRPVHDCQICGLKFIGKPALDHHLKAKHSDGKPEEFECDFCGKKFNNKASVYHHMDTHLPAFKCDLCDSQVKQSSRFSHLRMMHATGRKFSCKICSKAFKSLQTLKAHEKFHDKRIECDVCEKKFRTNTEVKRHKRFLHENPMSFCCEFCGKRFNQKVGLKSHLKLHDRTRQKVFRCQKCQFSSDHVKDLLRHEKFHERQEKKFAGWKNALKCPKCSNLCRDRTALLTHLRRVHPQKLFQCDLCGMYIKSKPDTKKHINVHLRNSLVNYGKRFSTKRLMNCQL